MYILYEMMKFIWWLRFGFCYWKAAAVAASIGRDRLWPFSCERSVDLVIVSVSSMILSVRIWEDVRLVWMRLSVERVLRALLRRLWINGDLNLNIWRIENWEKTMFISYLLGYISCRWKRRRDNGICQEKIICRCWCRKMIVRNGMRH